MSFPKYPEYKDSGVRWIGPIPAHWTVAPLNRHLGRNDGGVWGTDADGVDDTIVLRSTEQTIDGRWQITDPALRKLSGDERIAATLEKGDLLLTKSSGSALHIGKTTIVNDEIAGLKCCYSNFMQRLRTKQSLSPMVAWYILNNDLARKQFDLFSNSSTGLANLNATVIGRVQIPIPLPHEQIQIVTFLDRETAKIDSLVAEQRRLIELLKEKRQAVISHAVTKGLNPDVRMKPSGIEWLGDVPEHWEVKRLKHISPFPSVGIVVDPTNYVSDEPSDLPFIYGGDIREGAIDVINCRRISRQSSRSQEKTMLQAGDVLTVRVGAPGVTAVVPKECEGGNCASVMLIRRGNFDSRWLCYVMNTRVVRFQVEVVQYGAAQKQFNIAHAVDFWLPMPSVSEQIEIVAAIDRQTQQFDELQSKAERAITLLQERRTALISAAVTGKIDVRGLAPTGEVA